MEKSKIVALAGVTLLAAATLTACSGSNSGSSASGKTFNYIYETEPESLNYLTTGKAATSDLTANLIDGLMENDEYGNNIPSLAESWTVSKDGLTYTYKLRKDAKWFTADGEEYANVTAQDFVTGLKYAADHKSEALYLVQDSIKGLDAYVKGESKDFATVGVKAVDDETVQYTLNKPESYWNSKTTMPILQPANEAFIKSKGDKFGQTGDPSNLLYNGPYILKSMTAKSAIEFSKNQNYWDKDNVHIDDVKLSYFDGQDQDNLVKQFSEGALSQAKVFPTSSAFSAVQKEFKDNIVYTPQDSTSYVVSTNIDRQSYKHTSKITDAQKNATKKALLNKDFRQAITFAFDRTAYNSQTNGEEGATKLMRSLYVPPTFVQAGDKTFGELVQDKLATAGDEWKNIDLSDGQDGLYNPEKAKAEFAKAKEALQAEDLEFPIHIDMPVDQTNTSRVQRVQSMKQSIEKTLGADNVVIDVQQLSTEDLQNATLYAATAADEDWDLSDNVGWVPDFQDPSTYLDILKTDQNENTKTFLGFDKTDNAAAATVGLKDYDKLIDEASNETSDVSVRYEKYAAAQAWLTDSALLIPTASKTGRPIVTNVVPFSAPFSWSGTKGRDSVVYKRMKLQDKPVTVEEYNKAVEKWNKERVESNAKAQKEAAEHLEK